MNNNLILGKAGGTVKGLIFTLLFLLIITLIFSYRGYISDSYSQVYGPIINFFIFSMIAFFTWRNKRNNNFIEIGKKSISIRNAYSVDNFLLKDIKDIKLKKNYFPKYLLFSANGTKHRYFIGSLNAKEIEILNEYL